MAHFVFTPLYGVNLENRKIREKHGKGLLLNNTHELSNYLRQQCILSKIYLDYISLWMENAVIFCDDTKKEKQLKDREIKNVKLNVYFYGLSSYLLSIMNTSKNYIKVQLEPKNAMLYKIDWGIERAYFTTLRMGNQLPFDYKLHEENKLHSVFKDTFGIESADMLASFFALKEELQLFTRDEHVNIIKLNDLSDFLEYVIKNREYSISSFIENFVLTKGKLVSYINDESDRIWKVGVNRFRLGTCPIIQLNDEVLISDSHLKLAMDNWHECFTNGTQIYTGNDDFNMELGFIRKDISKRLEEHIVSIIKNNLREELNVLMNTKYHKIFGEKDIDYGDYDILVYSPETRQLYNIESKYIVSAD